MLAVAMLLWGWQHSLMVFAVIAAIVVECARVVDFRWQFDDSDFHRLGDVSGLGLLLLVVVQFADRGMTGIYGVLRWFPLIVLGLTLAQLYSTRTVLPLSAMFLSVRVALKRGRISEPGYLDMRLPLLVACLLSACAGERNDWIIPAEGALLVWLLWVNRPSRRGPISVVSALLVCALVASLTIASAAAVRAAVGPVLMDIMRERMAHWRDPFRSHMSLGDVGRLKVSDRIVMRIESPPGIAVPPLLHEATYSHLSNNVWLAGASAFSALTPGADGTRWDLAEDRRPFTTVTVSKNLIRNKAMLAVPAGAFRIEELPVEELKANSLGALKVHNGPALIRYRVRYAPGAGFRAKPGKHDLVVPERIGNVLRRTLGSLDIPPVVAAVATNSSAPEAAEVARTLRRFFAKNFAYSLDLSATNGELSPIANFIEHARSGHCEYFASATVLLLRAAGVPARYATGYAVQEYSELEQSWVVRRRHSHSWAVAWIDNQWVAVDTTPPQWFVDEAQQQPWWQPAYDLLSWLWHRFSRWRLDSVDEKANSTMLLWVLLPLVAYLAWRIAKSRRIRREDAANQDDLAASKPLGRGLDSEFYQIERLLAQHGLARPSHCSQQAWLAQLLDEQRLPQRARQLEQLVRSHYRLRFADDGLSAQQRRHFAAEVERWLQLATAEMPEPGSRRS